MNLSERVEQTRRVEHFGVDTSLGAKVLCYTDGPSLRKLTGFERVDPVIVRIEENAYAFINRNPYDVIVIEASDEPTVLDLVDVLDRTVNRTYSPYEKHGKPVVSVVGASEEFIRLLDRTYSNSGIRFVRGTRRDGVVDAGINSQ
mgnify:CR=1 FL=1